MVSVQSARPASQALTLSGVAAFAQSQIDRGSSRRMNRYRRGGYWRSLLLFVFVGVWAALAGSACGAEPLDYDDLFDDAGCGDNAAYMIARSDAAWVGATARIVKGKHLGDGFVGTVIGWRDVRPVRVLKGAAPATVRDRWTYMYADDFSVVDRMPAVGDRHLVLRREGRFAVLDESCIDDLDKLERSRSAPRQGPGLLAAVRSERLAGRLETAEGLIDRRLDEIERRQEQQTGDNAAAPTSEEISAYLERALIRRAKGETKGACASLGYARRLLDDPRTPQLASIQSLRAEHDSAAISCPRQ